MNLLENEQQIEKNKKTKTIMTIIIVLIVILVGVCIGLLVMISSVQQNTLKLNIDNKSISNFSEDIFLFEDGNMYISIKDFAKLVGYEAHNGDHKSESLTKCYIENSNEEAAFELNSNKISKVLATETNKEYFDIDEPVKMKNNKLYISIEGMQIGANCAIAYNESNKQITVFTIPYLVTYYTEKYNNAVVADDKADYSNKKALLYDMIVVMNENKKYGVIEGKTGKELIGTKYANIKFIESSKTFIVTTDEGKMGIAAENGDTKIEPNYDEIKQIDKDLNLYLVKNNKKQGVVNKNGNIVIHLEYDQIGVDITKFKDDEIKNQYLLFNKCIPVQRDKKWGLFDVNGKQIIPVVYDEIGCITNSQSNSLLIVPKYEGIVVGKDKKYGLIDSQGRELVPCILDSIYSITEGGENYYYMSQGETKFDVIDYIDTYVIKTEQNNNTNTQNNEISNETTTENNNTTPTNQISNSPANNNQV